VLKRCIRFAKFIVTAPAVIFATILTQESGKGKFFLECSLFVLQFSTGCGKAVENRISQKEKIPLIQAG
jgi:hypothetical protein